ncbi:hypothetical protein [Crocosphaera sp. Alani8]|uniref:hypothetical protein n=1 Tax=Crocosphaera sp. Alani8 TaxID=3038952 RepID=UPI00313C2AB7
MNNFPLLDLFIQLRKAGLSLGISEYKLMLTALQRGIGTSDYKALQRLCRTIWVKSPDELRIFNYYFDKFLEQETNLRKGSDSKQETEKQKDNTQTKTPQRIRLILVGAIFVLGATFVWWSVSKPKSPVVELPENSKIVEIPETDSSPSPIPNVPDNSPESPPPDEQVIPVEPTSTGLNIDYWWGFSLTAVLLTGCLLVLMGKDKEVKEEDATSSLTDSDPQAAISELIRDIEDEVQVAQIFLSQGFSSNTDFLPITRRQMKQSWRYLRHSVREGPPIELDIEATVEQAARQGGLLNVILMPRYVNKTELLLLIDREGSMVPFHSLSQRIAETASQEGRLGTAGIYYFHNCPVRYIYRDPNHLEAEPIPNVMAQLSPMRAAVLLISDAGASRGGLNPERIRLTKNFLSQVKLKVRQVAWLNPMPRNRWQDTTAQEIARFVPMFEMNRQGLDLAIDVLRGHSPIVDNLEKNQ